MGVIPVSSFTAWRREAMRYRDFCVQFQPENGERFLVNVRSPEGEDLTGTFVPPFAGERLPVIRAILRGEDRDFLRTSTGKPVDAREIGGALFQALFHGKVGECFQRSLGNIRERGHGLRIRLEFDPDDLRIAPLLRLPWELLYRAGGGVDDFLCLSEKTPVVRHLRVQRESGSASWPSSWHLLTLACDTGEVPLNLQGEHLALQKALQGQAGLDSLPIQIPTFESLCQTLGDSRFQVFHYMGHGTFQAEKGGSLLFEWEDGSPRWVSARDLATQLKRSKDLRLVFLNACRTAESFSSDGPDPFTGLATALVAGGIPAVVAMQDRVADDAAIVFAHHFYRALARNRSLEEAATEGRLAVHSRGDLTASWAIPVLFLRGELVPPQDGADSKAGAAVSLPAGVRARPAPPVRSRMPPFAPNPRRVDREEELASLWAALNPEKPTTGGRGRAVAVTGLAGVGKTQLAGELVHRHGQSFEGGAFWISFRDPAAVPAEVAACGRGMGLHPSFNGLALEDQVKLVEEAWQSEVPRLLVFDECEDPDLFRRWRPAFGRARVLVTSRRPRWSADVEVLPLGLLPRSVSLKLLRRFRPDISEEDPALQGTAEELGDLPLALHLAGSFLARYRDTPSGRIAGFLEELRQKNPLDHFALQGRGSDESPTGHDLHLGHSFESSYRRLNPAHVTDSLAVQLLGRAAHMAPGEPIPHSLLCAALRLDPNRSESNLAVEDALDRLASVGLMERSPGTLPRIHRLVAAYARKESWTNEARDAVEDALLAEAERVNKLETPVKLASSQVHLTAVTNAAWNRRDAKTASLCQELGCHLFYFECFAEADPYLLQALQIRNDLFGLENKDAIRSVRLLAMNRSGVGDSEEALILIQEALDLSKKTLGAESLEAAKALGGLGFLNYGTNTPEASSYYEQALAIHQKLGYPDRPAAATILNNLGSLNSDRAEWASALAYLERARSLLVATEYENSRIASLVLSNMAQAHAGLGDKSKAKECREKALAACERCFGPDHPRVADHWVNLGYACKALGAISDAKSCYERALEIRTKVLGPNAPSTIAVSEAIGDLSLEPGNVAQRLAFYKEMLARREAALGPKHQDVAGNLMMLGAIHHDAKQFQEARPYYERALAIRKEIFGAESRETADTLENLGYLLYSLSDFVGSQRCFEQVVIVRRKLLGPYHPSTVEAENCLKAFASSTPSASDWTTNLAKSALKLFGIKRP